MANHVYALQRVKVGVQSTTSYTKFLVAVPESYKTLFARRGRSSEDANDAAPPYPVPIYAGILPAPSVRRVLPGDVRLLTSDVKFTMLRDGDVGIFGERDEPSLVFLYAPHCDPCDEDLQAIAHEARAMHRGGMSIYMVVPSGAGTTSAENALRRLSVVDDIAIVPDRYGALFAYLQTNTMPRNYIFAREGTVAVARMGSFPDGELQHALARAGIDIAL